MNYYGGIETGGTKIVCMVGRGPSDIHAEVRIPTTSPDETLERVIAFFQKEAGAVRLSSVGIGSFGPVDLDPDSPTYGYVTTTIKPGWAHTNVLGVIQAALDLPVAIDTDVNAAALGEYTWGAGQGIDPIAYLTIGTGVGGGVISGGKPVHGMVHPEIGHMLIPHDWQKDPFKGVCQYHGDCLEGLASGPGMKERWGQPAETLPDDHPGWEIEAGHLGMAIANLVLCHSPRRIVLGGGVMQKAFLYPLVREKARAALNGYIHAPQILEHIDQYIVPPALGNRAGVLGAIALAMSAQA